MKLNKTREQLSEAFINSLKEDKIPWREGWKSDRPVNAASNARYRGVNAFWLTYAAQLKGYNDPRWCTYKQAQDHGWQVRRGEKGMPVEFWSLYDIETKKKISRAEAEELRETLGDKFKERIKPISSTSFVFNATQIDGIPELEFQREPINEDELIRSRDKLIDEMDLIFYEGGDRAFYSPSNDAITMPVMNDFKDAYSYMTTFLHEAGHATGHETRLNRNIENTFGSPDYAREELRAEIASAFTAQVIGLEHSGEPEYLDNHKAYIQSWIETLEKNPNELFAAIKDAEQISDYLIKKGGFELEWERDQKLQIEYQKETGTVTQKDLEGKYQKLINNLNDYVATHGEILSLSNGDNIPIVINAYGGPGAGKSVACMDICSKLKKKGYNAEYVQEYAKDLVYDKNFEMLDGTAAHQFEILKEQTRRVDRLYGNVDFIVTDSPVLLNTVYNKQLTPEYSEAVNQLYNQYSNFSFFIERDASHFQQEGRIQNLQESIQKDNEIKALLKKNGIYYGTYNHETVWKIVNNSINTFSHINNKESEKNIEQVTQEKIERLQNIKKRERIETENKFFKMVENTEKMRLQLIFDGKPNEEVRNILKKNGFKWSPKEKAWQRMLTENAKYAAGEVSKKLEELNEQGQMQIEKNYKPEYKNSHTYDKNNKFHGLSFPERNYDYSELEKQLRLNQNEQIKEILYNDGAAQFEKGAQLENPDNGYNQGMEEGIDLEIEIEA